MPLGRRQGSRRAEVTGTEFVEGRYLFINMVAHLLSMLRCLKLLTWYLKSLATTGNRGVSWKYESSLAKKFLYGSPSKRNVKLDKAKAYLSGV